jgi:hypothetical protein
MGLRQSGMRVFVRQFTLRAEAHLVTDRVLGKTSRFPHQSELHMTSPFTRRAAILAALMLGTSMLTVALTPSMHIASTAEQFDFD